MQLPTSSSGCRGSAVLASPSRACRAPAPSKVIVAKKERTKNEERLHRHIRIRKKLNGTPERPRLSVFRSNDHIYAQVIDDTVGHTLASSNTLVKEVQSELEGSTANKQAAFTVGKKVAEQCLKKGVEKVAFDRGGYLYHGRIKALAEGAREGGLSF